MRLSAHTLHERMAPTGPDDELKELGETLDALLARLEKAFDSQQRFIANASHELRTPLATQRAAIQIGLDDPSPEDLVRTRQTLLDNNRRSERLIEGLLVLARSERGLASDEREAVRLDHVVREEAARRPAARGASGGPEGRGPGGGPAVNVVVAACSVRGNRLLLAQLVANLLANAVTYNVPGGSVEVSLTGEGPCGCATPDRRSRRAISRGSSSRSGGARAGTGWARGRASACRSSGRSRWPTAVRSRRYRARRAAVSP